MYIFDCSSYILTFFSWCVFTGGLSSMQYNCGNDGIYANVLNEVPPYISCMNVYRQSWFIMSYEVSILMIFMITMFLDMSKKIKIPLVGLFSVGLMLYIDSSNQLLNGEFIEFYENGSQLHRIRTLTAGSIMTALCNSFMIIVLGWDFDIVPELTKPTTV